jgi:DNA-binding protein H-NS
MAKTYAQLSREIAALQAAADKVRQAEVKASIAQINEAIAKYNLTPEDFRYGSRPVADITKPAAKSAQGKSGASALNTAAKYGDRQGNTWSGRGPRPRWLRDALGAGKPLDSFITGNVSTDAAVAPPTSRAPAKRTSASAGQKVPPKYRDPNTGNVWSGRGSQPTWLRAAVKKGRRLDSFLIDQPDAAPAPAAKKRGKAAAVKPSPVSGTSAKKAVAKKAAAPAAPPKKAVATKAPAKKTPVKVAAAKKSSRGKAPTKKAPSKKVAAVEASSTPVNSPALTPAAESAKTE